MARYWLLEWNRWGLEPVSVDTVFERRLRTQGCREAQVLHRPPPPHRLMSR